MEITKIQEEVNRELADPATLQTLVETTFKGLKPETAKKAMVEGMIRGFKFKDFLEKNIYAIPFKENYSLVTSIDYARKIGMRSGIVGVLAPKFEEKDGKIISCSMTVLRKIGADNGEFTATVYFEEYYKKPIEKNGYTIKSLWDSKPRTMISKVAEMHALRKACPEELSQSYVEEEVAKETEPEVRKAVDLAPFKARMEAVKTVQELATVWSPFPYPVKLELEALKDELKAKLTPNENATV